MHSLLTSPSLTILGYGREGQSTYRFLIAQGYDPDYILVRDKDYDGILEYGGAIISGNGYLQGIEEDHCIFRAPGITTNMLAAQGVDIDRVRQKLTSQTEYFLKHYQGTVIGVTGTKGKSTTSTMIMQMLRDAGRSVVLGGNVGKPIFDLINFDHAPDYVVYELSSYMLESLNKSDWMIDYGMITSLFPHVHVKEHGSQEAYIAAKMEMISHSRSCFIGSQAFLEIQNATFKSQNCSVFGNVQEIASYIPPRVLPFAQAKTKDANIDLGQQVVYKNGYFGQGEQKLFETSCVQLLGEHNLYNICGVIAIGLTLGIEKESIQTTISHFHGLEHRLEFVGTYGGIDRYNDAIATTPDATLAAMKSFEERLGTLFLGGIEGPYQFHEVVETCNLYKLSTVILFPDTGARIKELLQKSGFQGHIFDALTMDEAVNLAYDYTPKGKVALLSCGSPSFSLWKGFEEKGGLYKQAILEKSKG